MYNSTMKPFVRPAPTAPAPTTPSSTLAPTPIVSLPSNVRPPIVYSRTEVPVSRARQNTEFYEGPALVVPKPPNTIPKTSIYNPYGLSLKPASYPKPPPPPPPPPPAVNPLSVPLEERFKRMGGSKNMIPFSKVSNSELVDVLTQFGIRSATGPNMKQKNYDLVIRNGIVITNPIPALEPVGKRKIPDYTIGRPNQDTRVIYSGLRPTKIPAEVGLPTQNAYEAELARFSALQAEETPSKSPRKNRFEQTSFMPMSTFTHQELRDMLSEKGETFKTGNAEASKKSNYDKLVSLGAIPPRATFMPRDEFLQLNNFEMATYLDENEMKGTRSGRAVDKLGRGDTRPKLIKQYDTYMTKMAGRGLGKNIKDEFAIIDGEIQAGNNNPQLLRDARKMLKQMVQQKMVTIYEAQKHMLHLRKINKI